MLFIVVVYFIVTIQFESVLEHTVIRFSHGQTIRSGVTIAVVKAKWRCLSTFLNGSEIEGEGALYLGTPGLKRLFCLPSRNASGGPSFLTYYL